MIDSKYNEHLKKFKDIHKNKTAILFATGPSIKDYIPFDNDEYIKIGSNRIYYYPKILKKLNYFFFGSQYYTDNQHRNDLDRICLSDENKFIKLSASYENGTPTGRGNITPEDSLRLGAHPFENNLLYFSNDVSKYSMLGHSIVFPSLQFILYTGINKLYLVGCDGGFTHGINSGDSELLHWWTKFKEFKDEYYSNVEIISINPNSLKGWFKDEVTK